ncbi:hypothetical protein [Saccharothrix algeriensis]|uniref:PPE family domain-containing protein n=2 Tax=Saccharothrix algeriensis TaxID=173560 RepID=A0ABS2S813_9PSEU|nr:hypothetical protein [Saccharothrix algeriensis]MBM7811990.1 hypothetical protein [Saccharothrix algeriensis]
MADPLRSPEPGDDDPPSAPHPGQAPGTPEQAPGNPGWTRALLGTTTAQREPLADGAELLPGVEPSFWRGPARERFTAARDLLAGEWRTALDAHEAVVRRVEAYSTFVHQLQHLWEADRGNPAALRHTADLHQRTAAALAAELLARAAELDAVAVEDAPEHDDPAEGEPGPDSPEPGSRGGADPDGSDREAGGQAGAGGGGGGGQGGDGQDGGGQGADGQGADGQEGGGQGADGQDGDAQDGDAQDGSGRVGSGEGGPVGGSPPTTADDLFTGGYAGDEAHHHPPPPVAAPDAQGDPTTPAQRFHLTEKLGVQLQAGVRLFRIPWEAPRR